MSKIGMSMPISGTLDVYAVRDLIEKIILRDMVRALPAGPCPRFIIVLDENTLSWETVGD